LLPPLPNYVKSLLGYGETSRSARNAPKYSTTAKIVVSFKRIFPKSVSNRVGGHGPGRAKLAMQNIVRPDFDPKEKLTYTFRSDAPLGDGIFSGQDVWRDILHMGKVRMSDKSDKAKLFKLKEILSGMRTVVVAYSGGVDSVFLIKVATDVLGKNCIAVTATSPTYPRDELVFAKKMAKQFGCKHIVIKTNEMDDKRFYLNPINRCYYCKKELFSTLRKLADSKGIEWVIDASNTSDKADFRPGAIAKAEYGVRSPLQEAGFTKDDIREASKRLRLVTWDKPAQACLASRFPYGHKITPKALILVSKAENIMRRLGYQQVRVRHYGQLCRVEVDIDNMAKAITQRKIIVKNLKKLGYHYVTLDLDGYRMGSMNIAIPRGRSR
jgi:uncharacterized protein